MDITNDKDAIELLKKLASENGLDIAGGKVRRSSSRFCLGVEHGDYNGRSAGAGPGAEPTRTDDSPPRSRRRSMGNAY